MKRVHIFLAILLGSIVILSSCGVSRQTAAAKEQKKEDAMYKSMAEDLCKCFEPMYEAMNVLAHPKKYSKDKVDAVMASAGTLDADIKVCMDAVKKKYPKIDFKSTSNPKAEQAMNKYCETLKKIKALKDEMGKR